MILKELLTLTEDANPSFAIKDERNAGIASVEIAKAGVPVDMECFMDVFYFNFTDQKQYDKALKVVVKKVDTSKEDELPSK